MRVCRWIFGLLALSPAELLLANITGSDLQNFNATTNGLDFITVQSSETLGPGIFNIGLFANYAVNTLPRYEDANGRESSIDDSIIGADVNLGIGLTDFWDFGISLPHVVYQDVSFKGSRGEFGDKGMTEIRANTKLRLWGDRSGGIAFVASGNYNLVENNPYVGKDAGPTINLEVAVDSTFMEKIAVGVNAGYRIRSPGKAIIDFPIEPLGDQIIASVAASYLFTTIDTKLIVESYFAFPADKETKTVKARSASASEVLAGLKYDMTDQLALHGGAGTEIDNGTASADWRIYTGLNYAFGFEGKKKEPKIVRPAPRKPQKKPTPIARFVEAPREPVGPAEPPGEGDEVFVLRGVNFAFDSSSRVLPGTHDILKELTDHLKKTGYERIIMEGHTDSVGSEEYNQGLGLSRATTTRDYIVKNLSVDGSKIELRTYGETRPVADNGNYQGRQINRRVVFRIFYPK